MSSDEASMPPGMAEYKSHNVRPISREFHDAVEQGSVTEDLCGRYYRALEAYAKMLEDYPWSQGGVESGGLHEAVRN